MRYLHPVDERSLNLTASKCVKRRRRRSQLPKKSKPEQRTALRRTMQSDERSAGERVPGTKPGLTLPAESKTHQRGASAVSLILLTASSASFVDASDARRALCRRASILSRTMRV